MTDITQADEQIADAIVAELANYGVILRPRRLSAITKAFARHREQSIAPYREALEKVREGLQYIRDGRYRINTICRAEVELARIDTTLQQGAK